MPKSKTGPVARTEEERVAQLANLAEDEAERRLRDGTASNQLIIFMIDRASEMEELKRQNLEKDLQVKEAKAENLKSADKIEALFKDAIAAFTSYIGTQDSEEEEEDYDDY